MCDFICDPVPFHLIHRPVVYTTPHVSRPWWNLNFFPTIVSRPFSPLVPRYVGRTFVGDPSNGRIHHRPVHHHVQPGAGLFGRSFNYGRRF